MPYRQRWPSVRRRPGARRGPGGGLPRAPDGTGRLAIVRPGRPKRRTAVPGQDGGPYRVRHLSTGQEVGAVGDGGGRQGKGEDGRGRWGTAG